MDRAVQIRTLNPFSASCDHSKILSELIKMKYDGSRSITFQDPLGIPGALVEISQAGYEAPMVGQKCIIDLRISLPAGKDGKLASFLCFDDGVTICGKHLTPDWGESLVPSLRTVKGLPMAGTWQEGFEGAHDQAVQELISLRLALDERKDVLDNPVKLEELVSNAAPQLKPCKVTTCEFYPGNGECKLKGCWGTPLGDGVRVADLTPVR